MLQRVLSNPASRQAGVRGLSSAAAPLAQAAKTSSKAASQYTESAQSSTLKNGVKLASVTTPSPLATIGVFVNAGSRVETHDTAGATQLLQHMAFKTTERASAFRIVRSLAEAGAVTTTQADRNSLSITITAEPAAIPLAVGILRSALREPLFEADEVSREVDALVEENKVLHHDAASNVWEALHAAAFGSQGLGRAYYPTVHESSMLNGQVLSEFSRSVYSPDRVAVVGVNVPAEALSDLSSASFGDLASSGSVSEGKSAFQSGDVRVHKRRDDGQVDFALGFQGLSWADKDKAALTVIESIFNGGKEDPTCTLGGVLSGGVSGAGLSTVGNTKTGGRLEGQSAVALNVRYSDTGLFALYGRAAAGQTKDAVLQLLSLVSKVKSGASEEEVARAKVQAKARLVAQFAHRQKLVELVGQAAFAGNLQTLSAKLQAIDQLATADIGKVAARILSGKPAVAAFGDLSEFPTYDIIAKQI